MTNPVKSAQDIDWDKMAKRLGEAFDAAMDSVEEGDYFSDQDSCAALIAASKAADALVKIAAEARADKESKGRKDFSIGKPPQ